MRRKFLTITLGVCLLLPAAAGAQSEDEEGLDLIEMLEMKVTSASKLSQSTAEAPSVVTLVNEKMIDTYGWYSLNQVLYRQPGFFPAQDYDRRTVGARGMFEGWNNNHLLMLIDGVPVNDNLYGTAYTSELTPITLAHSLEIIRGPGSALYGSNATNGVVSLQTPSAKDLENKAFVRIRGGEAGTLMGDAMGAVEGELFDLVVIANGFRTDGENYETFDGSGRVDSSGRAQTFNVRDRRDSYYLFSKVEGKGALEGLSLQVHQHGWSFETGHGWLWSVPDFYESMHEQRTMASIKYSTGDEFMQEYVLRYQRHDIDWNMRYYHQGAFEDFYPAGTTESLRTSAQDLFARAQFGFKLPEDMVVLAAAEATVFFYDGDSGHFSNTDLNDESGGGYAPWPNGSNRQLGPWFEWVDGKPVTNLGFFGQFTSGSLLSNYVQLTAGIRYDVQFFDYVDLADGSRPTRNKSVDQLSPRLGLVVKPTEDLSIKLLGGRAFRAPSPTEMFGANTWTLASNLAELKPEVITTGELAVDYKVIPGLTVRANGFLSHFENQIAYSTGNFNLSTNIYTLTTAGLESEVLFAKGGFSGFLNASVFQRVDEEIFEKEQEYVSPSPDQLTWAPVVVSNIGLAYKWKYLSGSISGHLQGPVERREKDLYGQDELGPFGGAAPRPDSLDPWFQLDARFAWQVIDQVEVGVLMSNLLDGNNELVKNQKYPFDYRSEGRRILGTLRIDI